MDPGLLANTRKFLLNKSFAISTAEKYASAWKIFIEFLLDQDFDMSLDPLCHFVEYLYLRDFKYNSIKSVLSGIAHGLKIRFLPDFTKHYIVSCIMRGIKNTSFAPDIRLPFTEDHVKQIIHICREGIDDIYLRFLYATLFAWAFHACLRASEYTEGKYTDHVLKLGDIERFSMGGQGAYRIMFKTFKHSPSSFPDLILHATDDYDTCPVALMDIYLSLRETGEPSEPIFVDSQGALSRQTVSDNLRKILPHLGLPASKYQLHSFRIGRATCWAEAGYSALQIRAMGRWFSDAFNKYIRTQVVLQ